MRQKVGTALARTSLVCFAFSSTNAKDLRTQGIPTKLLILRLGRFELVPLVHPPAKETNGPSTPPGILSQVGGTEIHQEIQDIHVHEDVTACGQGFTKGGITGSTGSIDEGRASGHDTDPQQDQHQDHAQLVHAELGARRGCMMYRQIWLCLNAVGQEDQFQGISKDEAEKDHRERSGEPRDGIHRDGCDQCPADTGGYCRDNDTMPFLIRMRWVRQEAAQIHMAVCSMKDVVFDDFSGPEASAVQQVLPQVSRVRPGRPIEAETDEIQLLWMKLSARLHAEERGTGANQQAEKDGRQQRKDQQRIHHETHRIVPIPHPIRLRRVVPTDEDRIFRDVDAIGLRGHPGRLLVLRQLTFQHGTCIANHDPTAHTMIHGIAAVEPSPFSAAVLAHGPVSS
mmetsp:Transcript_65987/g.144740  ORF Transcript_65987/g.144740 Transcript_65987/m.144740 type:complete len:397 (-) Transcript_65987:646-1836(-)